MKLDKNNDSEEILFFGASNCHCSIVTSVFHRQIVIAIFVFSVFHHECHLEFFWRQCI